MGQSVRFFNPNPEQPYSIRWNFDIQRALTNSLVLQVGYIGNHTVHLPVDRELNYVPPEYLSSSPVRDQSVIDALTARVPNPFEGLIPGTNLNGSTIPVSQLLMQFPQFSAVREQSLSEGSSYCHSLNVRLEQRYSNGLSLLANYGYSKLINRTARLNVFDGSPTKTIANEDRPHRIVVSASYRLPFGKGQKFASNVPTVADLFIGGWQVSTIYTWQLGQVLSWGNLIYYGGELQLQQRNVEHAFNTSVFNTVSNQQLSNNIRTFPFTFGNLRADGVNNADISLVKNFTLREGLKLQYRADIFNLMNRVQFAAPNLSATSGSFGTITSQANLPRITQMALRLTW